MDLPASNLPPATLPYGQDGTNQREEAVLRTFGLIVGAVMGIAAGILSGVLVWYVIFLFTKTESAANIASKVAGVCFLIATVACSVLVVDLRSKKVWFAQGFLVGAAIFFLLFGLIFLFYASW
jgi:uncharacterized membrane protein